VTVAMLSHRRKGKHGVLLLGTVINVYVQWKNHNTACSKSCDYTLRTCYEEVWKHCTWRKWL